MRAVWALTKRNLKIFFRDRMQVFFSLLSVLIIITLYLLFIRTSFSGFTLEGVQPKTFAMLSDAFIAAGMVAVTSITATLGALGAMVDDRSLKIQKDFRSAPIQGSQIVLGYVLNTFIVGMILSVITFAVMQLYVLANGGALYSFATLAKLLGAMVLSVFAGGSMAFCLVAVLRTSGAFGTVSTIVGTLIGFVMGVYMPLGMLPSAVQSVVKLFPMSYSGYLMRNILMEEQLAGAFGGLPQEAMEGVEQYRQMLGVDITVFGAQVTPLAAILVLIGTAALFALLGIMLVRRKDK